MILDKNKTVLYNGIVTLGYFTGDPDSMAEALRAFYNRIFETGGTCA